MVDWDKPNVISIRVHCIPSPTKISYFKNRKFREFSPDPMSTARNHHALSNGVLSSEAGEVHLPQ